MILSQTTNMNIAKMTVALALFVSMQRTAEIPPNACTCSNGTTCWTRGCSNVTNPYCNNTFDGDWNYGHIYYAFPDSYEPHYVGCNCPLSSSTATHNAFYLDLQGISTLNFTRHNYTTCTAFGRNARDLHGHVPIDVNNATDCCNYCCGRNDPYHAFTTTDDN